MKPENLEWTAAEREQFAKRLRAAVDVYLESECELKDKVLRGMVTESQIVKYGRVSEAFNALTSYDPARSSGEELALSAVPRLQLATSEREFVEVVTALVFLSIAAGYLIGLEAADAESLERLFAEAES